MAEIVKALDTAISDISTLEIFPLKYADSKDTAGIINQMFQSSSGGATPTAQNG